jgi:hypothetical protein
MVSPRAVSLDEAAVFAAARGLAYAETSAIRGDVDAPFLLAALAVAALAVAPFLLRRYGTARESVP